MTKNLIKTTTAIIVVLVFTSNSYAQQAQSSNVPHLASDFERMAKDINTEISIVDQEGVVREGILKTVTEDEVSVQFGSTTRTFERAEVASAERLKDRPVDGLVKGAIFGALIGLLSLSSYGANVEYVTTSVILYSGIGFIIDASQTHRETIYRAPAVSPAPAKTVAFRIRF